MLRNERRKIAAEKKVLDRETIGTHILVIIIVASALWAVLKCLWLT